MQKIDFKAMDGIVSSYYYKGGKVDGCAPAMNNPNKPPMYSTPRKPMGKKQAPEKGTK